MYDDNVSSRDQKNVENAADSLCKACISFLLAALFFAYTVYALAGANNQTLFDACGNGLWQFVISRLIIGCFTGAAMTRILHPSEETRRMPLCVIICALHFTSLIVGSILTHGAMENDKCVQAMSNASYTGTPLLAIISIFMLVVDGIHTLCAALLMLTFSYANDR